MAQSKDPNKYEVHKPPEFTAGGNPTANLRSSTPEPTPSSVSENGGCTDAAALQAANSEIVNLKNQIQQKDIELGNKDAEISRLKSELADALGDSELYKATLKKTVGG